MIQKMTKQIAHAEPFSGPARLTMPDIYGGSPDKPFIWRIPVLGERPVSIRIDGLPEGLTINGNIISGETPVTGDFPVVVTAANRLGSDRKTVTLSIRPDGSLRTPLLGFTTWNACFEDVTDKLVIGIGEYLVSSGLAEYGYSYVNVDSCWQGLYDEETGAVMPNGKFPDMKGMYSSLHALGLKGGIYSSPFRECWGCAAAANLDIFPGCTRGEKDPRFPDVNNGIGKERHEAQNVSHWCRLGVDYLKYDWAPSDKYNAGLMKAALRNASRDISFCVTVSASPDDYEFLNENCCSWRANEDTRDDWQNLLRRMDTVDTWRGKTSPGHFYDLDMLAIGVTQINKGTRHLTNDEELSAYTFHAFFPSPLQLSMALDKMTDFERDLVSNEEIIAVNQDSLCDYPSPVSAPDGFRVWERKLASGDTAIAVFNLSDSTAVISLPLDRKHMIRDLWTKTDIGRSETLSVTLDAHSAGVYRLS